MIEVRELLKEVADSFPPIPEGVHDQAAAGIRDWLVAQGADPADRTVLGGVLLGLALGLHGGLMVLALGGSPLQSLSYQAEVVRRWVDGELPVLSLSDMLGLPGSA